MYKTIKHLLIMKRYYTLPASS